MPQENEKNGKSLFPPNEPVTKPDHVRSAKYRTETERFLTQALRTPVPPRWPRSRVFAAAVLVCALALALLLPALFLLRG